jgi:hypothetical protein
LKTYKSLLFSQDQSDVKFVCRDGVEIPAHKAILAAASPYFASAFAGPWSENGHRGEWMTSHSSFVIKALLAFVYTGEVRGIQQHLMPILAVAGEFDILPLVEFASLHCIESIARCVNDINVAKLKDILQLAHLHEIEDLKMACFEFARMNAAKVLTNPEIMSLPNDDEVLWNELRLAITCSVHGSLNENAASCK